MRLGNPNDGDAFAAEGEDPVTRCGFAHEVAVGILGLIAFLPRRPQVSAAYFMAERLMLACPPKAHVSGPSVWKSVADMRAVTNEGASCFEMGQ